MKSIILKNYVLQFIQSNEEIKNIKSISLEFFVLDIK